MPLTRRGVDFSYDPPTGAGLRAAGVSAAMVYVTDPGPGSKGVTQAVYDDLDRHGVAVGFVWELGDRAALEGYGRGVSDARRARANLDRLAGPSVRRPIYLAVDFDAQPAQYPKVAEYLDGAASVLARRRVGVYGHADLLDWLAVRKRAAFYWQTYSWSRGRTAKTVHVYQRRNDVQLAGGTVDDCLMLARPRNWGQSKVL